ncbi:MAG: DMT family transporter [Gammaproteobacteria bacterium]|nr:DMT family transporter [Gammaproteobacteria bacterium]
MTAAHLAQYRKGQMQVAIAALFWSTGGLLVRLIDADDWTIIFWRSAFAVGFLICVLLVRERTNMLKSVRQIGWPGVLVSLCFAIDTILFVFALNKTSVANVLIMFSTAPFWAALLAWIVLKETVPVRTRLAMVASVAGIIIMVSDSFGTSSIVGDVMALGIAMLFAVPVVTIRRHPEIRMMPAVAVAAVLAVIFASPFALITGNSAGDMGLMAIFGILEYGIALVLFTAGARYIPAAQSMLIGLLETVLGPVWVWLAVGENPGVYTIAGGLVVLTALAVYAVRDMHVTRRVAPVI